MCFGLPAVGVIGIRVADLGVQTAIGVRTYLPILQWQSYCADYEVCDVRTKPSRKRFPTYRFDSPWQLYCGDLGFATYG